MACPRLLRSMAFLATLTLAACGQGQTKTGATGDTLVPPSVVPVQVDPFLRGEVPKASDAIELTAAGHRFNLAEITLKAGESNEMLFENADAGDLHNLTVVAQNPYKVVFRGELVKGVETGTYRLEALTPGEYTFRCDLHPIFMVGTLHVV